jgi:hypothetical protein
MSFIYQCFTIFEVPDGVGPPASHGLMARKLQRHWPDHSQFLAEPQHKIGLTYLICRGNAPPIWPDSVDMSRVNGFLGLRCQVA